MTKTLLRTAIFAVASVSFAMVAQAQMQDGAMGGAGMAQQGGMATQGGMNGMSQGGMGHSSMRHGSMRKRSMKMHRTGHMNSMSNSHGM